MAFNIVQHRRGSEEAWKKLNLVPADGEFVIVEFTDGSRKFKVGDGITEFNNLPYLNKEITEKLARLETLLIMADESLKNFSVSQTSHYKLITALQEELSQLNNAFDLEFSKLSCDFKASDMDTLKKAKSYALEEISNLNNSTAEKFVNVKADVANLSEHLAVVKEQLDTNISKTASIFADIVQLQDIDAALACDIKTIDAKYSKLIQEHSSEVFTNISQIEQHINKIKTDIGTAIQPSISSLEVSIDEIKEQHKTDFTMMKDAIAATETESIEALNSYKQAASTALESKANEVIKEVNNNITASNKSLNDRITKITDSIKSEFEEANRILAKDLDEVSDKCSADFSVINNRLLALNDEIITLKDKDIVHDHKLVSLEASLENHLSDVSKKFSDNLKNISDTHTADFEQITTRVNAIVKAQEDADNKILEELNNYITIYTAQITDLYEEHVKIVQAVYSEINKLSNDITARFIQIEQDLALDEPIKNKFEKIKNELDNLNSLINETTNSVQNAIKPDLDSIRSDLAAIRTDLDNTATVLAETLEADLEPIKADVKKLNEDMVTTSENVEVLNKSVEDLSEDSADLGKNIKSLEIGLSYKIKETQDDIEALRGTVNTYKDSSEATFLAFETRINETLASNKTAVEEDVAVLNNQLDLTNAEISKTNLEVASNAAQIATFVALPDGSTTGDAELANIRIGYDGTTYDTAGNAVRALGEELYDLKQSLPSYIPDNAVDGLRYENNLLYLTSKGEAVSEPVEIKGGSGGSGSISVVKLTNENGSNNLTFASDSKAELKFTYDSIENGISTGSGTCAIQVGGKTVKSLGIDPGLNIIDVAEFLVPGTNTVKIVCSDQYGASRSLTYTVTVIELRVTSTFDDTSDFAGDIIFKYTPYGAIEKTVHILIDNKEVYRQITTASGKQSTAVLPAQKHGSHIISAYISAVLDGDEIFSETIYYDIACIEEGQIEPVICSIFTEEETTEGNLVSIPYRVYDPVSTKSNIKLIISSIVSGQEVEISSTELSVDRTKQFWNVRNYPAGLVKFTISYAYDHYGEQHTISKSHKLAVAELKIDVEAETNDLQLFLTSAGRSNSEQNPAKWTFGDYTTTFKDFNWKSNGWVVDNSGDVCLRLNGDATATINIKPFEEDFKAYGKTFEFDFVVRDVNNRDAEVIKCFQDDRGFIATADTAILKSSGTIVSCNYKDEERVRISITVESTLDGTNFVSMYVNGVLSSCQRYASTDNFTQNEPVYITLGSPYCGLDIYNIRIYTTALPTDQVLENSIADMSEPLIKFDLFADNDIHDENTGLVSYEKVKQKIPVITFTGTMPAFKGDKKKNSVRMKFEHPDHPELNFDEILAQIDVQGTSSQYYVRKNWKTKHNEKHTHMVGEIPAKVFCMKVDYAEATGTHNTQCANFVETLYNREITILPAQEADSRVRTTITGFPCVIFEKATEDSEPVFSSKANFNFDKDAENAFGFTEDYDVECWEFCNNTSAPCNFLGEIQHPEDITTWITDFEPRYAQIPLLDADGNAVIYDGDPAYSIARFKQMHDWVCSTATYTVENGQRIPIVSKPLAEPVTYGKTTYTEDNIEYRLAKFANEFEDYFDMHYMSIYYVFTFFALMTDQRAKNMFLTYWGKLGKWLAYFYDNDTSFGINNEGARVFDYYFEDIDQLDDANVYNGQNSVLWDNFRICFADKIKETYADLRSNEKLTYDKLINQFITEGSDKWSAALYNEDAEYKYISMARPDAEGKIDASNLYQIKGSAEQHFKYFVSNRLKYCDSKWYAGDYPKDFIFLRIYTPVLAEGETLAVPANPNIEITPFSDMYAGVKYKANGTLLQQRAKKNISVEFAPPKQADGSDEVFNDTETSIYGASEISSLGDLSGLYCGVINVAAATKLTELIIGNHTEGYKNENFREIAVGSNRLLRKIDLTNCHGLGIAGENPQTTLDLSSCPNIEEIYAEGTSLQSITLPDSGYVKILHLPNTLNSLNIKNQLYIEELKIADYSNIKTICIENCPTLNVLEILNSCKDVTGGWIVNQVRFTGINWSFENADLLKSMFTLKGIDDKGLNSNSAWLVGTCHVEKLTGEEYNEIKAHYPYLNITYNQLTSEVIFMDTPNGNVLRRETIVGYNSEAPICEDPVEKGLIEKPTKEATSKYTFEWVGWTRDFSDQIEEILSGTEAPDVAFIGIPHKDALQNITGTRVLYPAFKGSHKSYTVHFVNTNKSGNIELQTSEVLYGRDAKYTGEEPQKQDITNPEFYQHTGWLPEPVNIVEELTCYAQFAILDDLWYTLDLAAISGLTDNDGNTIIGYTLNEGDSTIVILDVNRIINENPAVRIPQNIEIDGKHYAVISIDGFDNHNKLALLDIQEGLLTIDNGAFDCCSKLYELNLPESLTTIKNRAFGSCTSLKTLYIPANVSTIQDGAFAQCSGLTEIKVAESNKDFKVETGCLINSKTNHLVQGINTATIPDYVKTLGNYCFANTAITEITIPENISIISNNAFSRCENLAKVVLPNTIKTLDATCFAWCKKLSVINLPEGLTHIMTYIFAECALENILIPSTVQKISEMAFGAITTLKTVTFSYNKDTDLQLSEIHAGAFRGAGHTDGIVFNVPWSEQDAIDDMNNGCKIGIGYGCAAYKDFKKDEYIETTAGLKQKYPLSSWYWGVTGNVIINYNYKEEA